jgi:hypothetical protein
LRLVPQKTILILEQDDISRRGSARLAARFLQEHQGEKSDRFAVREQFDAQSPQPNGFVG